MMRACETTVTRDISSEKSGWNVRFVVSGITKTVFMFKLKSWFSENLLGWFFVLVKPVGRIFQYMNFGFNWYTCVFLRFRTPKSLNPSISYDFSAVTLSNRVILKYKICWTERLQTCSTFSRRTRGNFKNKLWILVCIRVNTNTIKKKNSHLLRTFWSCIFSVHQFRPTDLLGLLKVKLYLWKLIQLFQSFR